MEVIGNILLTVVLLYAMGIQRLTGIAALALAHAILVEVIAIPTPNVLKILHAELVIANQIIHLPEVTGTVLLIAVKVRTTLHTSNH